MLLLVYTRSRKADMAVSVGPAYGSRVTTAWETMLNRQLEHASRPLTRLELLLAHLDYAWDRARPRMDGVTDDEYFWEPAPVCWTVRRQPDGTCMADWASPEPNPAPFTTIAWRLAHVGLFLNMRANHRFGDHTFSIETVTWPCSANAALAWIDEGFLAYRNGVADLTEADLDIPPDGPPGSAGHQVSLRHEHPAHHTRTDSPRRRSRAAPRSVPCSSRPSLGKSHELGLDNTPAHDGSGRR